MKKILSEYCYVIANVLIGIAFGFAFFYLFLNFYHYQELRREIRHDASNDTMLISLNDRLDRVLSNVNTFSSSNYKGTLDYSKASDLNREFKRCVNLIRSDTFHEITSKEYLNIQDVYFLRKTFEEDVLNGCVIRYFYPLIMDTNNNSVATDSFIHSNRDLLSNYVSLLTGETSYLKSDLNHSSNYYFTTDNYSLLVSNKVRNGYYETIDAYQNVAEFLEDMSVWYRQRVGGSAND